MITPFIKYLNMARARDPSGDNVPEIRIVAGKGGNINLYHETLYGYVNPGLKPHFIKEAVKRGVQPILHMVDIQNCYKVQFCASSGNPKAGELLSTFNRNSTVGNNYWNMLQGAVDNNLEMVPHALLSEILQTKEIYNVLKTMFEDELTQEDIASKNLCDPILKFAFNK